MQIVTAQQDRTKHLLGLEKMMQVGAAVVGAGRTGAVGVERTRVVAVAGVEQVEHGAAGEGLAGAPAARRQHAVEHVDAAAHRSDDVGRLADAHQVRSEEHTYELQSLMRTSYAVFCLNK